MTVFNFVRLIEEVTKIVGVGIEVERKEVAKEELDFLNRLEIQ